VTKAYRGVLSIAGSDSGGGAGIQGDIKTISALGCYATTAITAVTVQNSMGVSAIHPIPAEVVIAQVKAVIDDINPLAIKIGMIYSAELATALNSLLKAYPNIPIVFDPVMVSSSGNKLIHENSVEAFKKSLFPIAHLVTPNLDEAALLAKMPVRNVDEMKLAAKRILEYGSYAVLLKGGHLSGEDLFDLYIDENGKEEVFNSKMIPSNNTHGTGCCLSSAIACYLAMGEKLIDAIPKAKEYVHEAILQGKDVRTGNGHGPLNHFFAPKRLLKTP
jgi:hydroxymethylpyrimidine/phosphomethylpyrimidine kinase